MTGLDQERLDRLAAARALYEDDLAAFYALPREATAAENLAADVDPLLNDIEWLLSVVQHLQEQLRLANIDWALAVGEAEELREQLDRERDETLQLHHENLRLTPGDKR